MEVNRLYRWTPVGMRKSTEGVAFQNRCHDTVRALLASRDFRALPNIVGWELSAVLYFPVFENPKWRTACKGERFKRRDVDGPLKIILDGIFSAIGQNDSTCVGLHLMKRSGYGSGRLEFMLQEREVMSEEPNATEMAQDINARPGWPVRVSPADHPALLRHYYEQVPNEEEVRFTHFDAWRLHIMDTLLAVFPQVQDRLTCPARTGKLGACFTCSDMRVVDCVCSNPATIGDQGQRVGLFDLCTAQTGYHLRPTERRTEEIMDETRPNVKSVTTSIIMFMFGTDMGEKIKGLRQARAFLQEYQSATDTPTKEGFIRLGVLLDHVARAGLEQLPSEPISYYMGMTSAHLPDVYRAEVSQLGELQFAIAKFKVVAGLTQREHAAQGAAPAAPAAEAPAEAKKGKGSKRRTKLQKDGGPDTSVPLPTPAVQLDLPLPNPTAAPVAPTVVADASVAVPSPGMPRMSPIEPRPKGGANVTLRQPDGTTVPVGDMRAELEGLKLAVAAQNELLRDLGTRLEALDAYLKKVGQAFNALKGAVLTLTSPK